MAATDGTDADLVTVSGLRLPAGALSWRFSRSSGPGGQHVNTSDSRVELLADLSRLEGPETVVERVRAALGSPRVVSAGERSQLQNRLAARRRLAERIERAASVPARRRPTRPTRSSVERRLEDKHRLTERKAARRPLGED